MSGKKNSALLCVAHLRFPFVRCYAYRPRLSAGGNAPEYVSETSAALRTCQKPPSDVSFTSPSIPPSRCGAPDALGKKNPGVFEASNRSPKLPIAETPKLRTPKRRNSVHQSAKAPKRRNVKASKHRGAKISEVPKAAGLRNSENSGVASGHVSGVWRGECRFFCCCLVGRSVAPSGATEAEENLTSNTSWLHHPRRRKLASAPAISWLTKGPV